MLKTIMQKNFILIVPQNDSISDAKLVTIKTPYLLNDFQHTIRNKQHSTNVVTFIVLYIVSKTRLKNLKWGEKDYFLIM